MPNNRKQTVGPALIVGAIMLLILILGAYIVAFVGWGSPKQPLNLPSSNPIIESGSLTVTIALGTTSTVISFNYPTPFNQNNPSCVIPCTPEIIGWMRENGVGQPGNQFSESPTPFFSQTNTTTYSLVPNVLTIPSLPEPFIDAGETQGGNVLLNTTVVQVALELTVPARTFGAGTHNPKCWAQGFDTSILAWEDLGSTAQTPVASPITAFNSQGHSFRGVYVPINQTLTFEAALKAAGTQATSLQTRMVCEQFGTATDTFSFNTAMLSKLVFQIPFEVALADAIPGPASASITIFGIPGTWTFIWVAILCNPLTSSPLCMAGGTGS